MESCKQSVGASPSHRLGSSLPVAVLPSDRSGGCVSRTRRPPRLHGAGVDGGQAGGATLAVWTPAGRAECGVRLWGLGVPWACRVAFQCWAGAGTCSVPRGPSVPAPDPLPPRRGGLFTELGAALHSRVSAFASGPGPLTLSRNWVVAGRGVPAFRRDAGALTPGRSPGPRGWLGSMFAFGTVSPQGWGQGAGPGWGPWGGWARPHQGVS